MQVIEIFKKLCSIAHCSGGSAAMHSYLEAYGHRCDYVVSSDRAGNVLCSKEGASVTLQAHYDMVCIGAAPHLELEEESGWLHAKASTLGADNGMGMAMMLALMEEGRAVDLLFTVDEEIGLIGARALQVRLKTPYLLNLDSEEEGIVTIGCAGGVDIEARLPIVRESKKLYCHETEISGLPGGHSGVDIDRGIPNAIKELAALLASYENAALVSIKGGERRNAIAKYAIAIVATQESTAIEGAKALGRQRVEVIEDSASLIKMTNGFIHGVRALDETLGIVETSINLAMIESSHDELRIHLSARSMEKESLEALQEETMAYFSAYGCEVTAEGFYTPWRPEQTPFAQSVLDVTKGEFPEATFGAIHAGLECGIIKEHFPDMKMASIGPNILYPHSTREKVQIASVETVYKSVKKIIEEL